MVQIRKISTTNNVINTLGQKVRKATKEISKRSQTVLPNHQATRLEDFPKYAKTNFKKDCSSSPCRGEIPNDYKTLTKNEFIAEKTYTIQLGAEKGQQKTVPAHYKKQYSWKPHYYIERLETTGKGSGTNSIKHIVQKSLQDPETQGRVTLFACSIDGKTNPSGFYYKLGFRFTDPKLNEECAKWLKEGGIRENSPFCIGEMYLPKGNIHQCLTYGLNI